MNQKNEKEIFLSINEKEKNRGFGFGSQNDERVKIGN
jgi:hypothetical protein